MNWEYLTGGLITTSGPILSLDGSTIYVNSQVGGAYAINANMYAFCFRFIRSVPLEDKGIVHGFLDRT